MRGYEFRHRLAGLQRLNFGGCELNQVGQTRPFCRRAGLTCCSTRMCCSKCEQDEAYHHNQRAEINCLRATFHRSDPVCRFPSTEKRRRRFPRLTSVELQASRRKSSGALVWRDGTLAAEVRRRKLTFSQQLFRSFTHNPSSSHAFSVGRTLAS